MNEEHFRIPANLHINENNLGRYGATAQRALKVIPSTATPSVNNRVILGKTFLLAGRSGEEGAILTGNMNGVCQTLADPRDVQLIDPGKGEPFAVAIEAGQDGVIDSIRRGDDGLFGTTLLHTGEDGILQSEVRSGDNLRPGFAFHHGLPDAPCVDPGPDRVFQTSLNNSPGTYPDKDDALGRLNGELSLSPNETDRIEIYDTNISSVLGPSARPRQIVSLTNYIIGHEIGHGVHVEHYLASPDQKGPLSLMVVADPIPKPMPRDYDTTDTEQMRVHLKHH